MVTGVVSGDVHLKEKAADCRRHPAESKRPETPGSIYHSCQCRARGWCDGFFKLWKPALAARLQWNHHQTVPATSDAATEPDLWEPDWARPRNDPSPKSKQQAALQWLSETAFVLWRLQASLSLAGGCKVFQWDIGIYSGKNEALEKSGQTLQADLQHGVDNYNRKWRSQCGFGSRTRRPKKK